MACVPVRARDSGTCMHKGRDMKREDGSWQTKEETLRETQPADSLVVIQVYEEQTPIVAVTQFVVLRHGGSSCLLQLGIECQVHYYMFIVL